jgi:hypothetical protein
MRGKLRAVGFNELLGVAFDLTIQRFLRPLERIVGEGLGASAGCLH